jgi:type II secretion system protein J
MRSRKTETLARAAGSSRRGFTLVELIVAVIVGTVVAGATTTAISTLVRGKNRATARHEAFRRAETAVSRMAMDLQAVIRDKDLAGCRVLITDSGATGVGGAESDSLLVFTRSIVPVRGAEGVPEGSDREVQYKLFPGERGMSVLWRRVQAGVDDYSDAGGVASPVVDGVVSLSIRAADSATWFDAWDSDSSGFPHAVSVTAVGISDDGTVKASARRVVAMDRTPIPPATTTTDNSTGAGTTGSTGAATGGTGATTGGGR